MSLALHHYVIYNPDYYYRPLENLSNLYQRPFVFSPVKYMTYNWNQQRFLVVQYVVLAVCSQHCYY